MPDQTGRFSRQEQTFIERYAATGDAAYAGAVAGYTRPLRGAQRALERPEVVEAVVRRQMERLGREGVPMAVDTLIAAVDKNQNAQVPWSQRNKAAEIILKYAATEANQEPKDPHEMSSEEIAARIAAYEQIAAARAKLVSGVEEEPEEPDEVDIFG